MLTLDNEEIDKWLKDREMDHAHNSVKKAENLVQSADNYS